MTLGRLRQFALPVTDTDRSEAFYAEVLGLPKLFRFGDLAFFDCDGVRLMLEGGQSQVQSAGVCHYFGVDAIEESVAALEAKGFVFVQPPHLVAEMPDHDLWMAFFEDPDGHMLALMEERSK